LKNITILYFLFFIAPITADENNILNSLYEQMRNDEIITNNLTIENTIKRNTVVREFCGKFITLPSRWKTTFASDKRINPSSVVLKNVSLVAGAQLRCRLEIHSDVGACFEHLKFSIRSPYIFEGVSYFACSNL